MPQLCFASHFAFFVHFFSVFPFLSFSDIVENAQIPLCLSHKFGCTAYWAPHDLLPPVPFNSYLFYGHIYYSFYAETMQMELLEYLEILSIMQDIGGILDWILAMGVENGRPELLNRVNRPHFIGVSLVRFPWVWCGRGYAGRGGVGLSGCGWGVEVEVVWGWGGEVWVRVRCRCGDEVSYNWCRIDLTALTGQSEANRLDGMRTQLGSAPLCSAQGGICSLLCSAKSEVCCFSWCHVWSYQKFYRKQKWK